MSGEYEDGYDAGHDSGTEQERGAAAAYLRAKGLGDVADAIERGDHLPPRTGPGVSYALPVEFWSELYRGTK